MPITQRNVTIAFLALLSIGTAIFALYSLITQGFVLLSIVASIICVLDIGLLIAYRRGWDHARVVLVVLGTIAFFAVPEPYVTLKFAPAIFIPATVALIVSSLPWVAGSAICVLLILLGQAGFSGVYADPANIVIYAMVVGGMILARLITDRALKQTELNAQHAEGARKQAEEQAHALSIANEQAQSQLEEQRRLLALVASLEIPATQLADGVLFAPLVGHLDARRTHDLTTSLLEKAHSQRARHIVLDIAGVAMVDTGVARGLIGMVQALRLLGCEVTISGISSDVAITLTQLGIALDGISTVRSPQEALAKTMVRMQEARIN